jgi:hypothetical protein
MTIFEKTIKDNARFSSLSYKMHIKFSMDDVHSNGSNSRVSQICWNPLIAVPSAFHVNKLYASSAVSWSSKDEAGVLKRCFAFKPQHLHSKLNQLEPVQIMH